MDFTKIECLEDGIWHLVDKTGEIFVHFEGNVANICSIVNSIEYEKTIYNDKNAIISYLNKL